MEDIQLHYASEEECIKWLNVVGISAQRSKEYLKNKIPNFRQIHKLIDSKSKESVWVSMKFKSKWQAKWSAAIEELFLIISSNYKRSISSIIKEKKRDIRISK